MALQSGHVKWILGELSVRTMPTMNGEQAEQIMAAQSVIKRALFQELKEAEAREAAMQAPEKAPEKPKLVLQEGEDKAPE
jgi:hypothetical protein